MKRVNWLFALASILAVALPASCPSPDETPEETLRALIYAANTATDNVSACSIDGTTGALAAVTDPPFAAGDDPASVAVDSSGTFLYAANNGTDSISAFSSNGSAGALTEVSDSPFAAGDLPQGIAVTNWQSRSSRTIFQSTSTAISL